MKNIVMLDNATLRGSLTALNYLQDTAEQDIKDYDIQLMCTAALVEAILLHDHIVVPSIHSADYPPIVDIAIDILGKDIISPLKLHEEEIYALHNLAIDDFKKWYITTPRMITKLHDVLGTGLSAKTRVEKWDERVKGKYSIDTVRRFIKYSTEFDKRINITSSEITKDNIDLIKSLGLQNITTNIENAGYSVDEYSSDNVDVTVFWMAFQTCVYDIISRLRRIPYEPHPVRGKLWKFIQEQRADPFDLPSMALLSARKEIGQQVNKISGLREYQVDIPHFLAFTLQLADSPQEVLPVALELRNDNKVKALRYILLEMQETLLTTDWIKKLQELNREFQQMSSDLVVEYYGAKPKSIQASIQLAWISFGVDIPIPPVLNRLINDIQYVRKPHLAFLHDVFQSVSNIWQLSDLYDKLRWGTKKVIEKAQTSKHQYHSLNTLRNRAKRYLNDGGSNISIILLDIKDFDAINYRYGREGGDRIIEVLEWILTTLVWGDNFMVSREGGDTFVILVLGADLQQSQSLAYRINEELQKNGITLPVKHGANYIEEIVKAELHVSISSSIHIDSVVSNTSHAHEVDEIFLHAIEGLKSHD